MGAAVKAQRMNQQCKSNTKKTPEKDRNKHLRTSWI
jgi:hypothetical protein